MNDRNFLSENVNVKAPGASRCPGLVLSDGRRMHVDEGAVCCPHCGEPLSAFVMPDEGGWDGGRQWACFNDKCSYYQEGWDWMYGQYRVRASYRYRLIDLDTNTASPLGVWSADALRDRIVNDG